MAISAAVPASVTRVSRLDRRWPDDFKPGYGQILIGLNETRIEKHVCEKKTEPLPSASLLVVAVSLSNYFLWECGRRTTAAISNAHTTRRTGLQFRRSTEDPATGRTTGAFAGDVHRHHCAGKGQFQTRRVSDRRQVFVGNHGWRRRGVRLRQ